jgi:quinol monooxygenase YgiN
MSEVIVIATIVAKADAIDTVKAELLKLVEATRKEQGCNSYLLHYDQSAPATFVFYENWASAEHLQSHMETEHFTQCLDTIEELTEETVIQELTQIAS